MRLRAAAAGTLVSGMALEVDDGRGAAGRTGISTRHAIWRNRRLGWQTSQQCRAALCSIGLGCRYAGIERVEASGNRLVETDVTRLDPLERLDGVARSRVGRRLLGAGQEQIQRQGQ